MARIHDLQADAEEWDEQYQAKCRETRALYVMLDDIAELLRRKPPAISAALKLIDEEMDG